MLGWEHAKTRRVRWCDLCGVVNDHHGLAAESRRRRFAHAERKRGRDGRIDGVAAPLDICCTPAAVAE